MIKIATISLLSCMLLTHMQLSAQTQKRKWEVGFDGNIYKSQMTDIGDTYVSERDGSNAIRIAGETKFNRSEKRPALALYVRTPLSRKNDRLWVQAGFGLWKHNGLVYFDEWSQSGPFPYSSWQRPLSVNVQYWHIPLSIQYRQRLLKNLSALFSAGIDINWQKTSSDSYRLVAAEGIVYMVYIVNSYSSRVFLSPKCSAALQYSVQRHSISAAPFVQLGNSLVVAGEPNSIKNFDKAKWKTPYGLNLQYFYRLF
ncbi:hypothetical protein DBR32_07555 [Taibaiella sp. KBW10]|uniref:hypothetical protein n=1 Tax=Taibaiella sp. KBW10 TaxID=2153357 RepID=UPI000F595D27|nr:hypothetical protein [Taibaiella sp. KBW10]RQO31789.1 hypothetical protein DBR32_07555 [Taibaiella sp. KBW10]